MNCSPIHLHPHPSLPDPTCAASYQDVLSSSAATIITKPPSSSFGMPATASSPLLPLRPLQSVPHAAVNLAKHQTRSHDTLMKRTNVSHCSQDEDTIPLYLRQQGAPGLVPADFSHFISTLHPQKHWIPFRPSRSLGYLLTHVLSKLFPFPRTLFLPLLVNTSTSSDVSSSIASYGTLKVMLPNYRLSLPQVPVLCVLYRTCHDCNLTFCYGITG